MTTDYERAMAEFEATLTPEERALESAIVADFDFAREVVSLRTALGISQRELSRRTGVPQAELSRMEHGRVVPTVARATRVLSGMGAKFAVQRHASMGFIAADTASPARAHADQPKKR